MSTRETVIGVTAAGLCIVSLVVVFKVLGKDDMPSKAADIKAVTEVSEPNSRSSQPWQGGAAASLTEPRVLPRDDIKQSTPQGSEINRAPEDAPDPPYVKPVVKRSREEMMALIKENLIAQGQFERLEKYEAKEIERLERKAEITNKRELRKFLNDERRELFALKRGIEDSETRREIEKIIQLNRDEMKNLPTDKLKAANRKEY